MKRFALGILLIALLIPAGLNGCRIRARLNLSSNEFNPSRMTYELVKEHNRIRSSQNLNRLREDERLNDAAQRHAEYMASQDKLSHQGEWCNQPSSRVQQEGYEFWVVAENIAFGQTTVEEVMQEWMDSPGHKKNILGNYQDIGIGMAKNNNDRLFWCVIFGKPKTK